MKLEHPGLFDIGLGEKVLHHVINNPRLHDQTSIHDECAQTACIMGWVVIMTGQSAQDTCCATTARDHLGLGFEEFNEVFQEMDNDTAIKVFQDYIRQAKEAQATPIEIPAQTKEMVNA